MGGSFCFIRFPPGLCCCRLVGRGGKVVCLRFLAEIIYSNIISFNPQHCVGGGKMLPPPLPYIHTSSTFPSNKYCSLFSNVNPHCHYGETCSVERKDSFSPSQRLASALLEWGRLPDTLFVVLSKFDRQYFPSFYIVIFIWLIPSHDTAIFWKIEFDLAQFVRHSIPVMEIRFKNGKSNQVAI